MMDLIDCARLRDHVETIAVSLAWWADRDDSKAQPEVRQAANTAVTAIDAALAELHRMRERLGAEMRESDDAAMRRSGELLRKHRENSREGS